MPGFGPLDFGPISSLPGSGPHNTFDPGELPVTGQPFVVVSTTLGEFTQTIAEVWQQVPHNETAEFTQTIAEVWVQVNTYNFTGANLSLTGHFFQEEQFVGGHVTFTAGNFRVANSITFANGHLIFTGKPFSLGPSGIIPPFLWIST